MAVIEDALSRIKALVTTRGQLETFSQSVSQAWYATVVDARCWDLQISVTPTGVNDTFIYIANDVASGVDLLVTRINLNRATGSERVVVSEVTGTAAGGTDVTLKNRALGSGKLPAGTFQEGADITGLTPTGEPLEEMVIDTSMNPLDLTDEPIRLTPGTAIEFEAVTATVAVVGTVTIVQQTARPVEVS